MLWRKLVSEIQKSGPSSGTIPLSISLRIALSLVERQLTSQILSIEPFVDSQQLTQEGLRRDYDGAVDAKAVRMLIGKVHDHLKGVLSRGLRLKISERRRKCFVVQFHFHQEPRFSFLDYDEVHFTLLLVP